MTVGELIKQLIDWLWAFLPIRLVHDWEQGVRCYLGHADARLTSRNGIFGTGLHFCWPFLGQILVDETNIEVAETDLQTLVTLDKKSVTFSLGLKYRVANLKLMYQSIHDARETLFNEFSSIAGRCAVQLEYDAIRERLCEQVIQETKQQMGEWGIEVISLNLINMSEARPIRLIMNRGDSSAPIYQE